MANRSWLVLIALLFGHFCAYTCAAQSPLEGDWIGGVDYGNSWQYMNLHFKSANQGVVGTVDFPEQGRMGLAVDRIVVEAQRVHVKWHGESGFASIDGQPKDGAIAGEFKQGETKAAFGLVSPTLTRKSTISTPAVTDWLTTGFYILV